MRRGKVKEDQEGKRCVDYEKKKGVDFKFFFSNVLSKNNKNLYFLFL